MGVVIEGISTEERGDAPLIGVVLLFGMVFIGVAVLAVTGMAALEALESSSAHEQAASSVDTTHHGISTVTTTYSEEVVPWTDARYSDDGAVYIVWYNESEAGSLDPDGEAAVHLESLGAIEYETGDSVIAYQSGGTWERRGSTTTVRSAPTVAGDDGLTLRFVTIDEDDVRGTEATVRHQPTDGFNDDIEEAMSSARRNGYTDVAIVIESEYHDGWRRHLESTFDAQNVSTDVASFEAENYVGGSFDVDGSRTVIATQTDTMEPVPPFFWVKADRGLVDASGSPTDTFVNAGGDWMNFETTVENTGDIDDEQDIRLRIPGVEFNTPHHEATKTLAGGESADVTLSVNPGQAKGLESGQTYEYEILTEDDETDPRGSFYYTEYEGVEYRISQTAVSRSGEMINVSTDIANIGAKNGSKNVTLTIRGEKSGQEVTSTTSPMPLEYGSNATVSWSINETNWPNGEYELDIVAVDEGPQGPNNPGNADSSATFEVTNGFEPQVAVTADLGVPEDQQVSGETGHVIPDGADASIEVNVTNTNLFEQEQSVTLTLMDDGTVVEQVEKSITIDGASTKQISLPIGDQAFDAGTIYQYDIATEDDSLDQLGSFLVVEDGDTPAFSIAGIDVRNSSVKPNDALHLDVALTNEGDAGEQFIWLEGFHDDIVVVDDIDIDAGASKTVTIVWDGVDAPQSGETTSVTLRTDGENATATVDVDPLLQVNSVDSTADAISPGESVQIVTELESVAGTASQQVSLERADGEIIDTTAVTVEEDETKTVTFDYPTDADTITERVSVTTDDDERDGLVVVAREGPICDAVDYDGSGTESDPYRISTIDELQCINEHDLDAHYELVSDIDAHGTEYWNDGKGFEPIGPEGHNYPNTYWQSPDAIDHEPFGGMFDGNGHVIDGLTINRPDENFVGLFGATSYTQDFHPVTGDDVDPGDGSVIKSIRLTNVSVVGKQHVGGLIGQAGGTVLDARSEGYVEGQEQLVGGLIGDGAHADIDNRLVAVGTVVGGDINAVGDDRLNHEGIGGLVGRATWNTQVSMAYTHTDVSGDKHVGAIIGTSSYRDSTFEQMYTSGTATADNAEAGAVVGTVLSHGDEFAESIYWDTSVEPSAYGEAGNWFRNINMNQVQTEWNGRSTQEMTGLEVNQPGHMENLVFEEDGGPWVAIPDSYPRFAWELAAEGTFDVSIDEAPEEATAGEFLEVEVTVTSRYEDSDESDVTQTIVLTDPDGQTVDTQSVTLPSTLGKDETEQITLVWRTDDADVGTGDLTVRSENSQETTTIEISPLELGPGMSDGDVPDIGIGDGGVENESPPNLGPGHSDGGSESGPIHDPNIDISIDGVTIH
ncbi:hypothetical protein OB919_12820 [Halobacteria archaeon AArc-curdl1]|uniref:Uncharacterized protein n=1 Tax=Natronosalvus hydrolyticus TaxID=2979988 RepID=A0AAP3E6L8_9EURY|nr:hypothetical protein [Halobacteria archaeon AArc-curdl1]